MYLLVAETPGQSIYRDEPNGAFIPFKLFRDLSVSGHLSILDSQSV